MPQETFFIPVDTTAGASPSHVRSSGRWKRRKPAKVVTFGCQIFLPDGTDFNHLVPKKATGKELLEYVFWKIDLREKEYFGLKFENKYSMKVWLDPSRKIKKQVFPYYLFEIEYLFNCQCAQNNSIFGLKRLLFHGIFWNFLNFKIFC